MRGMRKIYHCGFADLRLHLSAADSYADDARAYNSDVSDYPQMKVDHRAWTRTRKRLKRYLTTPDGCSLYKKHFAWENWCALTSNEKTQHSYRDCFGCAKYHKEIFRLKKFNEEFCKEFDDPNDCRCSKKKPAASQDTTSKQREMPSSTKPSISNDQVLMLQADMKKLQKQLAQFTASPSGEKVSHKEKRDKLKKIGLKKDLVALYTSKVSHGQWDKIRKQQYGSLKDSTVKDHAARLELYKFDKEVVKRYLETHSDDNKDIGSRLAGKWTQISKEAGLRRRLGSSSKSINSPQIIQKYAKQLGYKFTIGNFRRRITWEKCDMTGLAAKKSSSSQELRAVREEMIEKGEIDIGEDITFTLDDSESSGMNKDETVFHGRKLRLKNIRRDHMVVMLSRGLVRRSNVAEMNQDQLKQALHRGHVPFDDSDETEVLRNKLTAAETTRHMVIWQDHCDIAGHPYYVMNVWFLYNKAMYLTTEEAGFDVQSLVERPYLHILAKSRATVDNQLMYVPERIKELKSLKAQIEFNGRTYKDVVRFNSGDLPARRFEVGHVGSGLYSCICGVRISNTRKPDKAMDNGAYYSLQDRIDKLYEAGDHTTTIHAEKMKKRELIRELDARGVSYDPSADTPALKEVLYSELKGLKRVPSLVSTGLSLNDIACSNYEVLMCEPLHDLQGIILALIDVLPYAITDPNLKRDISDFCQSARGDKRMLRGCDCRVQLIKLTNLLAESKYQTNKQCKTIHVSLFALVEIQRLAYQLEDDRCPRDVLHMHLMALVVCVGFFKIFRKLPASKGKRIFGTYLHSLINHFPETYRLISLRSIMAEGAERSLKDLKGMAKLSSGKPENILKSIMVRVHFQKLQNLKTTTNSFATTQKKIEKSKVRMMDSNLTKKGRTVLDTDFVTNNRTLVLSTFKKIADFIHEGPGVWYDVSDGRIIFYDGPNDDRYRGNTKLGHFSSSSVKETHLELQQIWDKCIERRQELKIDLLNNLVKTTKDGNGSQQVPISIETYATQSGSKIVVKREKHLQGSSVRSLPAVATNTLPSSVSESLYAENDTKNMFNQSVATSGCQSVGSCPLNLLADVAAGDGRLTESSEDELAAHIMHDSMEDILDDISRIIPTLTS